MNAVLLLTQQTGARNADLDVFMPVVTLQRIRLTELVVQLCPTF